MLRTSIIVIYRGRRLIKPLYISSFKTMDQELDQDQKIKLIHYSLYERKKEQYNELKDKHSVYLPSYHSAVMTDDYLMGVFTN